MAVIANDFPPGPYTVTYKTVDIGLMEGPIRHQQNIIALPVRASVWGQHVINYIMQGGGVFIVLTIKEWDAGAKGILWPYNAAQGIYPIVGELMDTYFGALVLTALAGTPAATEGPITRTYNFAAILPGHNLDVTFSAGERNIPLVLGVLPEQNQAVVGQAKYFADT